jgi:hypothetical protein
MVQSDELLNAFTLNKTKMTAILIEKHHTGAPVHCSKVRRGKQSWKGRMYLYSHR